MNNSFVHAPDLEAKNKLAVAIEAKLIRVIEQLTPRQQSDLTLELITKYDVKEGDG